MAAAERTAGRRGREEEAEAREKVMEVGGLGWAGRLGCQAGRLGWQAGRLGWQAGWQAGLAGWAGWQAGGRAGGQAGGPQAATTGVLPEGWRVWVSGDATPGFPALQQNHSSS